MSLADDLREVLLKEERWEIIFSKMNGEYVLDFCEEVKDEFEKDGTLGPLVQQVYQARDRIADRLGVNADCDKDLALLIEGAEDFARTCGKLMYRYGYSDGANGR